MKGARLKGALSREPQPKPQRLSPGVYRSASGDLVTQGGRPIRRQPQAPMGAPEMGQQFGQMPGQAQGVGQQLGGAALTDAERMARGIDPRDPNQYWMTPSGHVMGTLIGWSPQESAPIQFGGGPTQNPWAPQMPQPSANQGGKYRLSPGVYGTREQAMRQYDQQMQEMLQPYLMSGTPQEQQQGGGGRGIANFPMDQRQREMGYVEDRFNAARNNNLFRGNPIKKLRF